MNNQTKTQQQHENEPTHETDITTNSNNDKQDVNMNELIDPHAISRPLVPAQIQALRVSDHIEEVSAQTTSTIINANSNITTTAEFTKRVRAKVATPLRQDIKNICLTKLFKICDSVESYVVYEPGVERMPHNTEYQLGAESEIFLPSLKIFSPDRVYVRLALNTNLFKTTGLTIRANVPMSSHGIRDIGAISGSSTCTKHFNGLLNVLFLIMTDNRIIQSVPMVSLPRVSGCDYLMESIPKEAQPSMILASRYTEITWFKRFITNLLSENDDMVYQYGKVYREREPFTGAAQMIRIAMNLDQYSATILNINARQLMADNDVPERLFNIIKAYTLDGVTIELPQITGLNPYNCFDIETANKVIFMSAFVLDSFIKIVLESNIRYFEVANIYSYEERFRLLSAYTYYSPLFHELYLYKHVGIYRSLHF